MAGERRPGKKKAAPDAAAELRRQAEERLDALSAAAPSLPAPEELSAAVHELRVHQIELEMQNEELRRAQLALEASRAKYSELFDLAPVGYLTLSGKGIVGDANLTAARLLGVERQTLVGQPFSAFVLAADRDAYYLHQRMLQKTGAPQTCELRLERVGGGAGGEADADAAHFWAHLESRPRREADGETLSSGVTFTDISEGKRASEELARHRERLERLVAERTDELSEANRILAAGAAEVARWRQNFDAFFNTIDDLLFVLDADGDMIHVNETVCRRLGYSEAELIGRAVLDVHPPERRDEAGRIVAAMLAGEAAFCPVPVVTRGGVEIPVETRVVPGVWDGEPALFGVTKDVSALNLSEEKFDRLFHGNPALMAVSRLPERRYTDVNEAFLSALGYSREEVLGRTAAELDLFVEPERQRASAEQLQAQGRVSDCELKVRRKDGAILDGLFSAEIIESQGRRYFLTVMSDQTERKRAAEALRATTELLSGLLTSIPDIVFFKDRQGVYLGCNAEFARFVGRDAADIVGATDHELFGKEIADFFREQDRIMMALGEPRHNEEWIEYPDGARILMDTLKAPLRDADGQVIGLLGVSRDITARQQAEEALREAALYSRNLIETSLDPMVTISAEGRITDVNTATEKITGRSRERLIDSDFAEYYTEPEMARAGYLQAFSAGQVIDYPLAIRHSSGAITEVLYNASVYRNEKGEVLGVFAAARDITERKEAEQNARLFAQAQTELNERKQAEEAQARSAAQLREQLHDTVKAMGAIVSLRDPYTAAHERRVTELAVAIAVELGLSEEAREGLAFAGEVHDIGKIGVPAEILSKPGALTEMEYALIKQHPQAGRELLGAIRFRQPVAEIVGQHQERLDGSGYPDGLRGDEIMLEARILAVADVVEAMASHRPYRAALGLEAALVEVRGGADARYDAAVVAACERVFAAGFVFSDS